MVVNSESSNHSFDLARYLDEHRSQVDRYVDGVLPSGETRPRVIHRAMRYAVFAGGKRVRPILALATAQVLERPVEPVMPLAAALELTHTYSLIHDDLPSMDDDDYRRGKPTLHKQFGEGIAVLAGDALLTLAFQHLAAQPDQVEAKRRLKVIALLARAIGTLGGMIAGQVVDLLAQGKPYTAEELEYIHESKTGALIHSSVYCAAVLCQADDQELGELSAFAARVGLAFQVVDDILDVEGSREEMGKESGKDLEVQKATYPHLFGLSKSKQIATRLVEEAILHLEFLGSRGDILRELACFISLRRS